MRFAFITTMQGAPWGGSEELWGQAALRLKAEGHDVVVSVVRWPKGSERVAELAQHGVEVLARDTRPPTLARRAWRKLRGGARWEIDSVLRKKPDLVVVSQGGIREGADSIECVHRARVPFAVILQCNAEVWWPDDDLGARMGAVYRAARRVFCVSRHNLQLLDTRSAVHSRTAGSCGTHTAVYGPVSVFVGLRKMESRSWPVWRGWIPVAKGQDVLLQLLARPEWRERSLEVNFYGAGWCDAGLRRLSDRLQLNQVRFRGHVEDITQVWEHNHMLLLPSRFEGLPLALVEAMWCARPATVTDVGGNAELCIDGTTGFVAAAATVDLLGQTLERAWSRRLEWRRMGNAARLMAEQLVPAIRSASFVGS